jgi:hypothetical protein
MRSSSSAAAQVARGCVKQIADAFGNRAHISGHRDCLADAGRHERPANDRRVWCGTENLMMCIDARQHRKVTRKGSGSANSAVSPLVSRSPHEAARTPDVQPVGHR